MKKSIVLSICLLLTIAACSKPASEALKKEHSGLYPVKQAGKWGFIDKTGKIVITPQFDFVALHEGGAFYRDYFSEGLAPLITDNRAVYIDTTGKIVFDHHGHHFSEGLAVIRASNGKFGFIDKTGKVVIEPQFTTAKSFSEGLAPASAVAFKWGYVNSAGKFVVNPQFATAEPFSQGLGTVCISLSQDGYPSPIDLRCGYVDKTGKVVVALQLAFDGSSNFSDGLAAVRGPNGTFGYIDTTGKFVIEPQFAAASRFSEDLAPVAIGSSSGVKWGFIDKSGKVVINPQFDEADPFNEELAAVGFRTGTEDQRFGFIDKTGKLMVNPLFNLVGPFSGGLAVVMIGASGDRKIGYIDKSGKYVWNPSN